MTSHPSVNHTSNVFWQLVWPSKATPGLLRRQRKQRRDEDCERDQLPEGSSAQRLAAGDVGRHVANPNQNIEDSKDVGDPAWTADHVGDDHSRRKGRKRLQAVEVRPVGPQGPLGQVAHVVARLDRIETFDVAEGDIGQRRGNENSPKGYGHGGDLRAARAPRIKARKLDVTFVDLSTRVPLSSRL